MINRPSEQGTIEENREWLIKIRNVALTQDPPDFQIAVGLSHSIAWLHYLIELEKTLKK